jgi:hypothetical protein
MLICLDFDGTYTLDPEFWDCFINKAHTSGHVVICATMRHEESEGKFVKQMLGNKVKEIYFSARKAKKPFLESLDIFPDIWIDDSPGWLLHDAAH